MRDGSPVTYDSGDYTGASTLALKRSISRISPRAKSERGPRDATRAWHRQSCVEDTGLGPFEGATVRVTPTGKVAI